jgi:4-hydroxybenzoyl-CoA thioesterase
MTFEREILVRFGHCDPAGIVFYPRYLEIFNNLVEDWCRQEELPFANARAGLPTVHLNVDFLKPSVMGEVLVGSLELTKLGRSSIGLKITLRSSDRSERVRGNIVLVLMDAATRKAVPIEGEVRKRLERWIENL